MLSNEVSVEIEILRKHGLSLRRIAQEVGCAVNTVRRHLALGEAPSYGPRKRRSTKLEAYESYLRQRQAAAQPHWIPATVLLREIKAQGYEGGISQLRAFVRGLRPAPIEDPLVRFETSPGEQMQVDWVEFRKGVDALYAFCATLGYSRASHVEFVTDMQVGTLIECHERTFAALGGVTRRILYDNMKTVVLERDASGQGQHRYHPTFLDYAKHCGFVIKLCRPYRAKTKGKVERFNGYLRRSFYVPLAAKLKQAGLSVDVVTANAEVRRWLKEVANARLHATTGAVPWQRLCQEERAQLQPLAPAWRGQIPAALPTANAAPGQPDRLAAQYPCAVPAQHPLSVYERLLQEIA